MEIIPGMILPFWSIITIISAAAALLIFILMKVFLNIRFLKFCDRAYADPDVLKEFKEKNHELKLLRRSRLVEKAASKNGADFITMTGIDKLWQKQFIKFKHASYLKKFIRYFPNKGIFFCILSGQTKKSYEKILKKMVEQNTDSNLLKKIGAASEGADFDGRYASGLFGDRFQELIELTGDPEWTVRHFAIKMLIYIDDERAVRAVREAFSDSSEEIRAVVAAEFSDDKTELCKTLTTLLLNDPSFNVRRTARLRIDSDFPEHYRINTADLQKPQLIHLLGQLHDGSQEDHNTAIEFLVSKDLEIRMQAALYLQRQKVLNRIFTETVLGDEDGFKRARKLLQCAAEVNCTSFLQELGSTARPAVILLSAELLKTVGGREYIERLGARVFSQSFEAESKEHFEQIYTAAVESISLRGSDRALEMLNTELIKHADEARRVRIILPLIPVRGEDIFIPTLISLLKTVGFPETQLLRATIERFPPSLYLEELISILHSSPSEISDEVRKNAFMILGELKMPCCLQVILENLKLLNPEEQKKFAVLLTSFDQSAFEERAAGLLKSSDSTIKAAIMAALPATGIKRFLTEIKEAAKDPDPDVRIAGIRALADYGDIKSLSSMTPMLRDPVERVRRDCAEVISSYGTPAALNELKNIITDENEVYPVKSAAVYGLGMSKRDESIPILVDILNDKDLQAEATAALSVKTRKGDLRIMTELFKDAAPHLREYIAEAFKAMGESVEPAVTEILQEDISSLRELLSEILLKTGFIEATVRKLRHRRPDVRKKAAALLSLIQTKEAFKGIVLASRDPDSDVRVEVLKALEKLNTADGEQILKELKEDPDRRVRKYTLWAMERLEAKNLE